MSELLHFEAGAGYSSTTNWVARAPQPLTQEGRILAALGQLRGPLPHVSLKSLERYYGHLARKLDLPFEARCPEEQGTLRSWTAVIVIHGILPPANLTDADDLGLRSTGTIGGRPVDVPLIELEVAAEHPNAQLIEDYWYWFWNWRFDPRI